MSAATREAMIWTFPSLPHIASPMDFARRSTTCPYSTPEYGRYLDIVLTILSFSAVRSSPTLTGTDIRKPVLNMIWRLHVLSSAQETTSMERVPLIG